MKFIAALTLMLFLAGKSNAQTAAQDSISLEQTTRAIRDAFGRGDVAAIVALHHPNVIKYFGGDNVVNGRAALAKGLTEMFKASKLEFVENDVESTSFNGSTAFQTVIFTIKVIPKNGGEPTYAHGRSMVVYVRYKESPYGWVSIREMTQAAPTKK
jgi:ketosteroid isomerase-like protein